MKPGVILCYRVVGYVNWILNTNGNSFQLRYSCFVFPNVSFKSNVKTGSLGPKDNRIYLLRPSRFVSQPGCQIAALVGQGPANRHALSSPFSTSNNYLSLSLPIIGLLNPGVKYHKMTGDLYQVNYPSHQWESQTIA